MGGRATTTVIGGMALAGNQPTAMAALVVEVASRHLPGTRTVPRALLRARRSAAPAAAARRRAHR